MTHKQNVEAQRIRDLRAITVHDGKRLTQAQLAEKMGLSEEQIKRYEKYGLPKRPGVRNAKALLLAKIFGVVPEYIKGETSIKDPLQYYAWLEQSEAEAEDAALAGAAEVFAEEEAREVRYKNLFSMCGYQYEYIGRTTAYDFGGISGTTQYNGPHELRDSQGTNNALYLNDDELKYLMQRLSDTVAFECYRIQRGRDKSHGNS